jgi:tripartite-type tricarboxylate transporter receptor subunit TctC
MCVGKEAPDEIKKRRLNLAFGALPISFLLFSCSALSQTPFYQGKTITIIQGTEAGGSSDVMTRAMLPYLKKHIRGEPTMVSEYMPGGGGIKAANHIYKNVRPDGLTIGRIGGGLVANAVLGEKGVLYDLNKLIYLGSPHSTYHWVFITRREAGLKNLDALRSTPGVRVGAQAVGHSNYFVGRLFAYLIGFKDPRFVVGYSGTELDLALIRGELDGRINNADTLMIRNAEAIERKENSVAQRKIKIRGVSIRQSFADLGSPARGRYLGKGRFRLGQFRLLRDASRC